MEKLASDDTDQVTRVTGRRRIARVRCPSYRWRWCPSRHRRRTRRRAGGSRSRCQTRKIGCGAEGYRLTDQMLETRPRKSSPARLHIVLQWRSPVVKVQAILDRNRLSPGFPSIESPRTRVAIWSQCSKMVIRCHTLSIAVSILKNTAFGLMTNPANPISRAASCKFCSNIPKD